MTASTLQTWTAACLMLASGAAKVNAGESPRYLPKPAQVIAYEEKLTLKGSGENPSHRTTTWRIWVIGKNEDGSARMLVCESMNNSRSLTFAQFDLYPDGTVPLAAARHALQPFPTFSSPAKDRERREGWLAGV